MKPRLPNSLFRTREYLTEAEVGALVKAARSNRNGDRDAAMVLAKIIGEFEASLKKCVCRARSWGCIGSLKAAAQVTIQSETIGVSETAS